MTDVISETVLKAAFAPIRPFVKKLVEKRQLVLEHGSEGSLFIKVGIQDDKKPGRAVGHICATGYPREIALRYIFEAQRPEPEPNEADTGVDAEEEGEDGGENDDAGGS